jgi:hypothetical protein
MADEDCVNLRMDFNRESRITTFLFENVCEAEVRVEDSFSFTREELANPTARIEFLASYEYSRPYGVCVKFASPDGKLLRHLKQTIL